MDIRNKTRLVVNENEKKKLNTYIAHKILSEVNFDILLTTSVFNIIKNQYPCEIIETDNGDFIDDYRLEVYEKINPYLIYDWQDFLNTKVVKKKTTQAIHKVTTIKQLLLKDLNIFFDKTIITKYIKEYFSSNENSKNKLIKRLPLSQKPTKLQEFTKAGYDIDNLPLLMSEKEIELFIDKHIINKGINTDSFITNREYNVLDLYKKACELQNLDFDITPPKKLEYDESIFNNYKIILLNVYKEINIKKPYKEVSVKKLNTLKLHNDYYSIKQVSTALNNCFQLIKRMDESHTDFNFIIETIAKLNAIIYKFENIPETIDDIFKFNLTKQYIFEQNVASIFNYIFINEKTKAEIEKLVNFDPKYNFPETRKMRRHFVIHSGGTNTGKTYNSIRKLISSDTGVYLAPLRLLALENQETMIDNGVLCSLSTGEEEDIIPNATHISSTVEKANLLKKYDLCVIDECQMINDRDRGWAWTEAILGMQAPEIHLCTAPIAVDLLVQLIEDCGDTYEIINHERVTPLIVETENIFTLKEVKPGDALICFSKKKVLSVSGALAKLGINCSIIYGALPYATRKKQFERFLNKEAEVVVSTDAIAMGLNLPIKRIIFLEMEKYDGQKVRPLQMEEIKQIAGRAGRRGIYDEGFVNSFTGKAVIRKALNNPSRKVERAKINFPDSLTEVDKDLIETVKVWATLSDYNFYEKTDIFRLIYILEELEKFDLTKKEKLQLANIPFQETEEELLNQWKTYIRKYMEGEQILEKPKKKIIPYATTLDNLELYYKKLDLYFSFSKNMNMEIDKDWLDKEKLKTAEQINIELVEDLERYAKKCSRCGKPLPWDFMYNICEECYYKGHYE